MNRLVTFVCLITGLAGCAAPIPQFQLNRSVDKELLLPAPPEVPRYRYLGELAGEVNFIEEKDSIGTLGQRALSMFIGMVAGESPPVLLQRPQSGVVDTLGNVFVTDVGHGSVIAFLQDEGRLAVWEEAGPGIRFDSPVGIALEDSGSLLVADSGLGKVIRLSSSGAPLSMIGGEELLWPTGIVVDRESGRIFVSDTKAHDIKVYNGNGKFLEKLGKRGEAPGQFNGPTYLALDKEYLYVTDTLNARVQVLDKKGSPIRMIGRRGIFLGDLSRPKGVAVDDAGRVYVVESYFDHLLVYSAEGELLLPIGGAGPGVGNFYLPSGVWVDHRHRVYVADMFNARIIVFEFLG